MNRGETLKPGRIRAGLLPFVWLVNVPESAEILHSRLYLFGFRAASSLRHFCRLLGFPFQDSFSSYYLSFISYQQV